MPKGDTTFQAVKGLLEAEVNSSRRSPPRYSKSEHKRIPRLLDALGFTEEEKAQIYGVMEFTK